MNTAYDAVEAAILEVDKLRRYLKRGSGAQVRTTDEKSIIKATGFAWFNNHRTEIIQTLDIDLLHEADQQYKELIFASDRAITRVRYEELLKSIRRSLIELRSYALTPPSMPIQTTDAPPIFSTLIADVRMQTILERRWEECTRCIEADAPLAATVMMGGLIEGLLLARINSEPNISLVFRASKAPKNKASGNTIPLSDWTLRHFIDVAHELGWITQSAKDVGVVLRDYRNYIHPQKELSHGVVLDKKDAALLWEITKNISRQLL